MLVNLTHSAAFEDGALLVMGIWKLICSNAAIPCASEGGNVERSHGKKLMGLCVVGTVCLEQRINGNVVWSPGKRTEMAVGK